MFWVNAPFFSKQFIDCPLQDSGWPLGFAIKSCAFLRDRMLADPSFLFKIGTEVCYAFSYSSLLLLLKVLMK